jgi:predicted heme/steroid binding protein
MENRKPKFKGKEKEKEIEEKIPLKDAKKVPLYLYILLFFIFLVSLSYSTTESVDFGYKVFPKLKKYVNSPPLIKVTEEELAAHDGSDPDKPIWVAIAGEVFDVTSGKEYYGKGGSYSFFAGKDAARAFVTGCFQTHLTHDTRGLSEKDLESIQGWVDFYKQNEKYIHIGQVIHKPIDPTSPIPPPCKNNE